MIDYNLLLQRQIKKSNLTQAELSSAALLRFIDMVNDAYFEVDEEKKLLERSIEISSKEYQSHIEKMKNLQAQIIHNEKMAGIGQLSAGIAHEINNPLGFVQSNFETLKKYLKRIDEMLNFCQEVFDSFDGLTLEDFRGKSKSIKEYKQTNKMANVLRDIPDIMSETEDGLSRMEKIVKSLLGFARKGVESDICEYDLNKGIIDTLTIANNEIKYYAEIITEFGNIPFVEVYTGEINQVILNLLVNATHAIKSKGSLHKDGRITITTYADGNHVICEIKDNGIGIPKELEDRIFEPFFTTKEVGKGTGLGLSIAHDIIVEKHKGKIKVESVPQEGTKFIIQLPIKQVLIHKSNHKV